MNVIGKIYWFLSWAIVALTATLIVLVAVRLLANQMNVNPFRWSWITLRRLTDPLIGPLRRALARFGVDPKYAPLVTIIVIVVLGWILLQLVTSVANTTLGLILSIGKLAIIPTIGYVLYGLLGLYIMLLFVRVIFSWVTFSYSNRFMRFVVNTTEPLLAPLRRMIPLLGGFDISPMIAFFIIWIAQSAVAGTLLRGWPIGFFG
ncbi:MAG TPA: YggT family protein [Pyrinomonadaceae bacterium]|nr:YggT family protein [Pyrinomonadaceae bacterium]